MTRPRTHEGESRASKVDPALLGAPPNRIDLLTSLTGVTFDEAWASRVEATVGRARVNFIGREALILDKRPTGWAQDRADLEALGASEER